MKNLIIGLLSIGTVMSINAQTEIMKTSEVKKTQKVTNQGVSYNTKVKVITKKTKEKKLDPNQKHLLNQNLVGTPVTVEKTIMIDNDLDPLYDTKTKVKYFKYKGVKYDFLFNEENVLITYTLNDKTITSARMVKSVNNNFYFVEGKDFNGVGYYNKEGDFVIEYNNNISNKSEQVVFETHKM
ncbi:hypothetical protein [Pseudofulvibacter geojedonensis]|uniref:Uncharacterized protein n=1 Tax=Pseudofulvibacter geojedonensis TaxID=1123758 RepID=A0ABW3I5H3_9FLAO